VDPLVDAARATGPGERWQQRQQRLDLDRFLAFTALEVLLWNEESYGLGQDPHITACRDLNPDSSTGDGSRRCEEAEGRRVGLLRLLTPAATLGGKHPGEPA